MPSAAPSIGRALVIYPWADRLVQKDSAFSAGAVLPCRDVKVRKKDLAATLLAVAFWGLREDGAADLEPFEKKRLFMKSRKLGLRVRDASRATGLGRALLAGAAGELEKDAVDDLVWRWLGEDTSDPSGRVIDRVVELLAQAGYATLEQGPGFRKRLKGHPAGTFSCERLAELQPAFEQVAAAWQQFSASQAELAAQLVSAAGAGVARRREQDDSDSGGDSGPDFD